MLVLTRKKGESLLIGGVKVTVVEVRGNTVRLGVDAPKDVSIVRGELQPKTEDAQCSQAQR